MCGRFDVDLNNREIDRLLAQLPPGSALVKTGEVFPTNNALTLILKDGQPTPEALYWGFPGWDGKKVIFNARAETALKKPMFKKALLTHPAAIPTTGFYEWRADPETGRKQKFIFTDPDSPLLWLAGFWDEFPENESRFTILTTAANPSVQPWHSRMPVLLSADAINPWLTGENREVILSGEPFALKAKAC